MIDLKVCGRKCLGMISDTIASLFYITSTGCHFLLAHLPCSCHPLNCRVPSDIVLAEIDRTVPRYSSDSVLQHIPGGSKEKHRRP